MPLNLEPNLRDPDAVYTALVDAHRGLDASDSAALNSRLIIYLVNHIGDETSIREAIARAAAPSQPNEIAK